MKRALWPTTVEEARRLQEDLRGKVRIAPLKKAPKYVAGCDASYAKGKVVGAACLYACPGMEYVEEAVVVLDCAFPYVPGYLSFREGPAIAEAIGKLGTRPGLLLIDGQGIAHPRGMGIASHVGMALGVPSVGCAKSRLVGDHGEPGKRKGSRTRLVLGGVQVGAVVRTRTGVRPVFVSPGHGIDVRGAVEAVLAATGGFRLPEPLRCAHRAANGAAKVL
jgi:deoxyribonuclease V